MPKDPSSALRYFRKIEVSYSPDLHREIPDPLLEPWMKAICNSAVIYIAKKNFRMALRKASEVLAVTVNPKEASEISAVREKAKKIEERCGKEISQGLYPVKPARSSKQTKGANQT